MKTERPKDLKFSEWHLCHKFAFEYAKQHGWFEDISRYEDIKNSETAGHSTYEQGLNLAIVSCRFWRAYYQR